MTPSSRPAEHQERLPPDPASAGRARRLVRSALVDAGLDDLVDTATLLVSEVVTNAILHAGTPLTVTVRTAPRGARVEVNDGSPLVPAARNFDQDAATGRGLAIVGELAEAWGAEQRPNGKVVWFEMGTPSVPSPGTGEGHGEAARHGIQVHLVGVPVALARATLEYGDAVLRELALLSFSDDEDATIPAARVSPALELSGILGPLNEALSAGRSDVEVRAAFAPEAAEAALQRLALVDEADRLAREGRLLIAPALPEIAACRRWLLGQVALQLCGEPPTAWRLPSPGGVEGARVVLGPAERARLDADSSPAVVADRDNRVVHVNAAAGELLGWPPGELVGRRLTTIIPEELREAHLAGFTRLQLSGRSRLLGRTVRVPALRRDGARVVVELTIELFAVSEREQTFLARLAGAPDGADAPTLPDSERRRP